MVYFWVKLFVLFVCLVLTLHNFEKAKDFHTPLKFLTEKINQIQKKNTKNTSAIPKKDL